MRAMTGAATFATVLVLVACGGDSTPPPGPSPDGGSGEEQPDAGTGCTAGAACDTGNPCTNGTCAPPSTCAVTSQKPDGTACGSGQVCASGQCGPICVPAASCTPENVCMVGTTTCPTPWSAPQCTPNGPKPDGTDCGDGKVCSAGSCQTKTSVTAVTVQDTVVLVNQTATLMAQVVVGSGSPSLEVDWASESCPGATVTPARGISTTFYAPSYPVKCRVRATSVADPSKSAFAYVIVEKAPLRPPLAIPIGAEPYGITMGIYALGHYCVFAMSTSAGTLTMIDVEDGSVKGSWYIGANPRGNITSDPYRRVWITVTGENKVARLDQFSVVPPMSGPPVVKFDVGSMPHGLAVRPSDASVWVANYGSDSLTHLDSGGVTLGTFSIGQWGHAPTGVAFDGSTLWVATSTAVLNLDTSGHLLRSITPVADPYGIIYDGHYVWFANHASNTIVRITPASGATATYTVGANPLGIASDGDTVWVANTGDNTVSEVRAADGTILSTLKTGLMPYGVVVDFMKSVWVSDYGSGDVRRLF